MCSQTHRSYCSMLQFPQMCSQTHRSHCTMLQFPQNNAPYSHCTMLPFPQNALPNAPESLLYGAIFPYCAKNAPYCKKIPLIWKKVPLSSSFSFPPNFAKNSPQEEFPPKITAMGGRSAHPWTPWLRH